MQSFNKCSQQVYEHWTHWCHRKRTSVLERQQHGTVSRCSCIYIIGEKYSSYTMWSHHVYWSAYKPAKTPALKKRKTLMLQRYIRQISSLDLIFFSLPLSTVNRFFKTQKHYVSAEGVYASNFKWEAPNLLDPLRLNDWEQKIISRCYTQLSNCYSVELNIKFYRHVP
jgi:hypothetical protein